MSFGARRHTIVIQRETQTTDTAGQPIRTWADWMVGIPAAYKITGSGETDQLGKKKQYKNITIETAFFEGATNKDRIIINGKTSEIWGITAISDEDGTRRGLTITAALEVI
jgi:SPP1 family predicted phage head-tail adaptor